MKRFKDFKPKQVEPIVVTALPVHGSHAGAAPLKEADEQAKPLDEHDWFNQNDNTHISDHNDLKTSNKKVAAKLAEAHHTFNDSHENYPEVKNYTISSRKLNHYHIERASSKNPTNDYNIEHLEKQTKGLDNVLKQHRFDHDVHLYHGANYRWDIDKDASKHPQRLIKMPSYLSTSHNKRIAHTFAYTGPEQRGDVVHIHAKRGQHGLYIGDRVIGDEHETLLPRNQTLKIHPKPTHLSDGTRVWHAKIVDQGFDES